MQWCQDFGLNESESEDLLKALHFSGVVLHFAGNEHLSSYIFLNPTRVFQQITESLNLRYIKYVLPPKHLLLLMDSRVPRIFQLQRVRPSQAYRIEISTVCSGTTYSSEGVRRILPSFVLIS